MAKVFAAVLLVVLAPFAPASSAEPAPADGRRLFVLDLTASGVDPALTRNLSEVMLAAIREVRGGTSVVGQAEMNSMLAVERQKDLLGCADDAACLAELGGALGADLLATGSIGRVGRVYLINLKLIDTRRAQVLRHVTRELRLDDDLLISAVRQLGANLVDESRPVNLPSPTEPAPSAAPTPPPVAPEPPFVRTRWLRAGLAGHHAFSTVKNGTEGTSTGQSSFLEPEANLQVGVEVVSTLFVVASGSFSKWSTEMDEPLVGFQSSPALGTSVYSLGVGLVNAGHGETRFAWGLLLEAGHCSYDRSQLEVVGTTLGTRYFIFQPTTTWAPVTTLFADVTTVVSGDLELGARLNLTMVWVSGSYRSFTTGVSNGTGDKLSPFLTLGLGLTFGLR